MSGFGTFRTSRDVRLESGMRVKAEVANHSGFMGSRPRYGNSRQLRFIEKWSPGERLTVGIVKMSVLQKLAYASEVFTKE